METSLCESIIKRLGKKKSDTLLAKLSLQHSSQFSLPPSKPWTQPPPPHRKQLALISVRKMHLKDPKPIEFCSKHPKIGDQNKRKRALEESK
jgi:hypothetical protein